MRCQSRTLGTAMTAPPSASSDSRYRTGLIVCGVLEIFVGLLLGLTALFLALTALGGGGLPGLETAGDAGSAPGTLGMASCLYAGVALLLLGLGVGSILPRRWVRPLVLYLASLWLLAGLLLLVVVAGAYVAIGSMVVPMEPGAESPLGMLAAPALYLLLGLIIFAIYVVLPAALLLFHRRRGLKEAL